MQLCLFAAAQAKQVIFQHSLRTFTIVDKKGNYWKIIDPPLHWFQQPVPQNITIDFVPDEEVRENCRDLGEIVKGNTKKIVGCAVRDPNEPESCKIYVADNLTDQSKATVVHHERAHCHGWPRYHPTREALPLPRPNPMGAERKEVDRTQ